MNDVQQLVKDNPGLQQYLLSAQKLQEFVQKLSGDMLDREQRQVDALLDLKHFVDEQDRTASETTATTAISSWPICSCR